ncbi:hypothetical protein BDV59DRAFT_197174 [Aspergillus ambiguus]|uniref:uncharacterized protein n=1 Tax=Aspergillus ambiguus TaxID=176160 RepID=UPI003CCDD5BE
MANTIEEFAQLEPLWDKAIQSPEEITLEEKHQLLEWPPLDMIQANAQKYLGHSVESLLHKAATDPNSLTFPECRLIKDDFRVLSILDRVKYENDRARWLHERPDLKTKREQAYTAVLSPEESQAVKNLELVFYPILTAYYDERERRRGPQRPRYLPQEWIQSVIDREDKSWGYLFYHHRGQEGWEEFQWQFNDFLTAQYPGVRGLDQIEDFKAAEFVEFEAKDQEELDFLREDFRRRRDRGNLKPGILLNIFFLVTDEARLSYSQARQYTFAWAIDPDWSGSTADEDGYDGRVKISGAQIYFRFYEFMSTRRFTLKDIWRDFHQVNETQTFLPGPLPAWQFTNLDKPVWPDA